jgi:hypothetical protein
MKKLLFGVAAAGVLFGSTPLHAALSWSSQVPVSNELKKEKKAGGGHGHGSHGRSKSFYLSEASGAEAEVWFPTLVRRPLTVEEQGEVKLSGTGVDNYHLLYARRKGEGSDELALRYHYLNGKPTGESPRLLIGYRKGVLDIVPSPLTREHQRYQSGKPARYTVLFKNKPLVSHPLTLTTSNGTTLELVSDREGKVVVALPDDFENIKAGRRANKPGEFVVAVSHSVDGTDYHTTLSADYHVNPSHWRSSAAGLLAMLAGFVGGLIVVRRKSGSDQEKKNA